MRTDHKKTWRKKVRELLAVAFGGRCTICGYDKTTAALDYHHVDPKEKDKLLCIAMRNGHSWNKIVQEARKCTILCCRCHRELHAGIAKLPKDYATFNEEYAKIKKPKKKEPTYNKCPICGGQKVTSLKFCSKNCSEKSQRRFEVSKSKLANLLETHSRVEVGRMFGVTDNAIKKRCIRLGIPVKTRKTA